MELILIGVGVVVALVIIGLAPSSRRIGEAEEAGMRAVARGADVDHQFKRPPNDGGLL
jgi:hypothetical protein